MQSIAILKILEELKNKTGKNGGTRQMFSWQNVSAYAARV